MTKIDKTIDMLSKEEYNIVESMEDARIFYALDENTIKIVTSRFGELSLPIDVFEKIWDEAGDVAKYWGRKKAIKPMPD